MTELLQASDAMKIVRQSEGTVTAVYVHEVLNTVKKASEQAVTFITADQHPNPNVREAVAKKLESLGYRVQVQDISDKMKISWSK